MTKLSSTMWGYALIATMGLTSGCECYDSVCTYGVPGAEWTDCTACDCNDGSSSNCDVPFVDSDGDGLSDDDELLCGTDPYDWDSDDDYLPDSLEDADGDGYTNADELAAGSDPTSATDCPADHVGDEPVDPATVDTDGDGVPDLDEGVLGTDPGNADTDGDGFDDGAEGPRGTDPLNPDTDGDGTSDGDEVACGSSPLDPFMQCDDVACP